MTLIPIKKQTLELKIAKELAIATPAFVSDCLETLEEIGMEAAEDFEEKGGNLIKIANIYMKQCDR